MFPFRMTRKWDLKILTVHTIFLNCERKACLYNLKRMKSLYDFNFRAYRIVFSLHVFCVFVEVRCDLID